MPNNVITNAGSIVNILDDLSDVTITTPQNNDTLCYKTATGMWENVPKGGAGGTSVDDLTDADTTTVVPENGELLYWDGNNWIPRPRIPLFKGAQFVYSGASQPYVEGVVHIVQHNTNQYDTDGFISNNTTLTIPAGCGGYYHITAQVTHNDTNSVTNAQGIIVNSVVQAANKKINPNLTFGSTEQSLISETTLFLNPGDQIQQFIFLNNNIGSTTGAIRGQNPIGKTFLEIVRVGV